MDEFNELIELEDSSSRPTTNDPIIRNESDILIYANRSRNAECEWEIRSYRIATRHIRFGAGDLDRAEIAAIFALEFDTDDLTPDDETYASRYPIRDGVPVPVAVDGKPAIAAWLYLEGSDHDDIAEQMGVSDKTVTEYLSRFRSRATGIPADVEPPKVGEIMPEVPAELTPADNRRPARKSPAVTETAGSS